MNTHAPITAFFLYRSGCGMCGEPPEGREEWFAKGLPVPDWAFTNEDGSFLNEFNFRTRKFYPLP
jgi:hypothetical protein